MDKFLKVEKRRIENKNYLVPVYNLEGFEHFLLPQLQFKGTQHVYFNPHDIDQLYKQKNIDPDNLDCNLKYDLEQDKKNKQQKQTDEPKLQQKLKSKISEDVKEPKPIQKVQQVKGRFRPLSRITTGNTHFIHIPFTQICREMYENIIKTQIDPNDLDSLVDVNALHAPILQFRLGSIDDLPRWQKILKSLKLKKIKVAVRGVGIFPVKLNTNYTRQLFIKLDGLEQLIHQVVSKGISEGLIDQKQLTHITFDKKTDMYRTNQQHVTFLKTKDTDIIDAGPYLKVFSKLNLGKVNISQIRLSMLGTFEDNDYFNEYIVSADK